MFAILLETGSETGLFPPAVMTRGGGSAARLRCRWAPARFSIPMNLGMNLGLRICPFGKHFKP
jgi:hypothetical protein